MGSRRLHFLWGKYRWSSIIFIAGLLVIFFAVTAFSLRANNLRMLELREAVFKADETAGDVDGAIKELQTHVASHMNSALPKLGDQKAIQLKYTYERHVAAEETRVSSERVRINQEAVTYCESIFGSSLLTRSASCVQEYIAARPVAPRTIPVELYTFDFVSPAWTPDVAGISLIITVLLLLVLLFRFVIGFGVKRSLASHI